MIRTQRRICKCLEKRVSIRALTALPIVLPIALWLAACGSDKGLAGGTGTETLNGIAGGVRGGDGPVHNAKVSVFPTDFNPYRDTLPDSLRTRTDKEGRFEILGIPAGRYNVLVEEAPSEGGELKGPASMVFAVPVDLKGKTGLPNMVLKPRGGMRVPRGEGVAQGVGYLYVPGSPWALALSGEEVTEEFVILSGVAAATYAELRFVGGEADLDHDAIEDSLVVVPAETATVNLYLGWAHSRILGLNTTTSGAGVDGDVAGFPVLVRLDSGNFDFSQAGVEGQDIRFARPDGLPLFFQIERWDVPSRQAEVWVRMDTIRGNSDSGFFTLYWGHPDAPHISNPLRVFSIAGGFAGVWHLGEEDDGAHGSPTYRNSAQDANHGLDHIADGDRDGVAGFGKGFMGTDWIQVPAATSILKPAGNITVSAWYKGSASDSGGATIATMGDSWGLETDRNGKPRLFVYSDSAHHSAPTPVGVLDGRWHHLAGTYDGASLRAYVDGILMDSEVIEGTIDYSLGLDFFIGKHGNGKTDTDALGHIDEVQVSAATRNPDWIKLSYESQKPGSKLIEFR